MVTERPQSQFPDGDATSDEARRDRAALIDRLFREHNEALIRFLLARLRSPQEAREVAQEAYVRLLSLDAPGAVSYLRAFLFKTAANLAVDRQRRDGLHARATASPLFGDFADVRTPERQVAATETLQRLERLVAAMPIKCRRVFMMRRFEGMDIGSIARELKLSKRMVRVYLARALLHCQACLDIEPTRSTQQHEEAEDE